MEFYMKTVKDTELKKIEKFREGCWINVENITEEEIEKIKSEFEIDNEWIQGCIDVNEKPRVEKKGDNVLIITRIPFIDDDGDITTSPFGIIITKNFIMTISSFSNTLIEDIKKEKNIATTQRVRFVLKTFEKINLDFSKYLHLVRNKYETIEDQVAKSLTNDEINVLLKIQKTLIYFSSAIVGNEIVFEKINSGKIFKMYEEDKDIIEDIMLSNKEIYETIKILRDVLSNTLDAYASIVSNNLNIVMKFLTSMSIILSFSVLIASFYGMNVSLPFQQDPLAFLYIVLFSILSFIVLYIFFKRKNWL